VKDNVEKKRQIKRGKEGERERERRERRGEDEESR